jgi:hypothetical protein
VRRRVPEAAGWLAAQVTGAMHRLRGLELQKQPGVAEAISWTRALDALGVEQLDAVAAERTLGAVLKYEEDVRLARATGLDSLISGAG